MFKINLAAFYEACGVTPPNAENTADQAGMVEVKDGTDLANLCRRSGIPKDAHVTLTFPDVCSLPTPPAGPIPIPYPNAALNGINDEVRKSGYSKVKVLDSSKSSGFKRSLGDEAGAQKGVARSTNMGKPTFHSYSLDVKMEGKNVVPTTSFR